MFSSAYKGIFDLLTPKEYFIPRPIHESRRLLSILLYKINENFYLLERNANVESMDLICKLANFNNNEDIYNLFNDMRNLFLKCGYLNDSYMGSIEETYRKILMYSKYKKFKSDIYLSDDDKIRYGSNIDERLYKKLFKK